MPLVSGNTERFDTPHDSHFLGAVREMTSYRPHLNVAAGASSTKAKKRSGERALTYEDVIAFLRVARREGAKRNLGAEMLCVLVNNIIRDATGDEQLDVIARPLDAETAKTMTRREEEFHFAIASAELVTRAEAYLADGVLDLQEARDLHASITRVERHGRRLVVAAEQEGQRGTA